MTRRTILTTLSFAAAFARPVKGAKLSARRPKREGGRRAETENSGPVLFELTADERWPIRGLDPALHIGGAVLDSYRFGNAENTTLIFTCYDASQLQEGAAVFLRYGQDESSRIDFPNFAWSTVKD
jgi:hypothetical protein